MEKRISKSVTDNSLVNAGNCGLRVWNRWAKAALLLVITACLMSGVACGDDDNNDNDDKGGGSSSGLTLKQIRAAVEKAGYETRNGHTFGAYSEVVDGFTLHAMECKGNGLFEPVLECKNEKAAIAVAEREAAAGYNVPVRNGKFLSFCTRPSDDLCSTEEKVIITAVLNATPTPPNYDKD
jgi:hypothetical protein